MRKYFAETQKHIVSLLRAESNVGEEKARLLDLERLRAEVKSKTAHGHFNSYGGIGNLTGVEAGGLRVYNVGLTREGNLKQNGEKIRRLVDIDDSGRRMSETERIIFFGKKETE